MTKWGEPAAWLRDVAFSHTEDRCLTWPFGRDSKGYGALRYNTHIVRAHVVVCERFNGPKPAPNYEVAHSCGKGHEGCVAGEHLYWATHVENAADMVAHGTAGRGGAKGERVNTAKLTETDVRAIRLSSASADLLGVIYGCTPQNINYIKARVTWRHVK